jgi:hypothetical protein
LPKNHTASPRPTWKPQNCSDIDLSYVKGRWDRLPFSRERRIELPNPTCAESRVGFRQINALVEKLALHFLQSCCGPRLFPRESHFMNENHGRFQASMAKVGTTCQNCLPALSNCLI